MRDASRWPHPGACFGREPVDNALGVVAAGASMLRITDFDAIGGAEADAALITDNNRRAGVPVEVACGIRPRTRAELWHERGAGQGVLGTLAVQAHDAVKALAKHPQTGWCCHRISGRAASRRMAGAYSAL